LGLITLAMDVKDIITLIEGTAPLDGQADWDNCGVQVARLGNDVTKLAVALDPRPEIIRQAVEWGAEMILTHHPLFFQPKKMDVNGPYLEILRTLLGADCLLYAAHTSLDSALNGPVGNLADGLGIMNRRPVQPLHHDLEKGFGLVGTLPESMKGEAFLGLLADHVDRNFWTLIGEAPETISVVAYCKGSGGSLLGQAKAAGADVYITGDMKYHLALDALDAGLFIIDVGHFQLEEDMMRRFAGELETEISPKGVTVRYFAEKDPLQLYTPGA
jgi:dinuclear metal center YbgI/SA1388 family protein